MAEPRASRPPSCIDLVLDERSWTSWDTAPDRSGISEEYAAELRRRAGPQRRRRVGPDRRGADARAPGRGADGRVRVPRRVDRARLGRPAGGRDRAGDPRGPAAAGRPGVGRYADAGGHAGVRADGADLPGGRGAPRGRAAVPRLPPPPDHRRGDGLVGLARPRDGRRARRAGRLPRARASTRRSTASRSPRVCRPPRTSSPTASSTASSRRRTCRTCSAGPSTS